MEEFIRDFSRFSFLQNAVMAAILASIAAGIVGSYVTVRRIVSVAGAIAHSTLGGMGAALYLNREVGLTYLTPLHGAIFAALLSALIIGVITLYGKQREGTVLSAVWSVGMAIGIFFLSRTRGYNEDLMSYLFGNILMVRKEELWLIGGLDLLVAGLSILFYNKLLAVSFDEEFARLRGVNTGIYYLLLLALTALTVVVLTQVVGIVMVIALLSIPAATAAFFSKRLWQMMVYGSLLSMFFILSGLVVSYKPDYPAGATVILLSGAFYILVLSMGTLYRHIRKKKALL